MKQASLMILKNKDRFLMHLRDNKPNIPYPNYWSFIGGGAEKRESPLQTAERECLEETGLIPKDVRFIGKILVPPYPLSENDEVSIFRGEIDKEVDKIVLTEGQRLEYFHFEDFNYLKMPTIVKKFVLEHKSLLF
jgi:8-oxo-dGTP diphosphatase